MNAAATPNSYERNGVTPTKKTAKSGKNNGKNAAILRAKQPSWNDEKAKKI